ncbi:MAG: N-acetyltransferase [Planctomycetota bacterium]
MTLQIRDEAAADFAAIEAVTTAAFRGASYASGTEALIVTALRDAGELTISLVAVAAGSIVGHVAISPVKISDGTTGWFGLGPISVLPQHQRSGIGSQLMEAALARLRADGARGCVVLGDPGYYGRFGFRAEQQVTLADVPPEYFQVLSFDATLPQGRVSYAVAFDVHG